MLLLRRYVSTFILQTLSVLLYLPTRLPYVTCFTNSLRFQGASPDHLRVESSCCCQLCCFARELVSFDTEHVTRFSPIGKIFELGGIKSRHNVIISVCVGRLPTLTLLETRGIAAPTSRSQSRSHAYLFCVFSQGLSRKRETACSL